MPVEKKIIIPSEGYLTRRSIKIKHNPLFSRAHTRECKEPTQQEYKTTIKKETTKKQSDIFNQMIEGQEKDSQKARFKRKIILV